MATRNERKRLAKARLVELQNAVTEAFALAAIRLLAHEAREARLVAYPSFDRLQKSSNGHAVERRGTVTKGKFVARSPEPSSPLKHDGNVSRRGQLRVRWSK